MSSSFFSFFLSQSFSHLIEKMRQCNTHQRGNIKFKAQKNKRRGKKNNDAGESDLSNVLFNFSKKHNTKLISGFLPLTWDIFSTHDMSCDKVFIVIQEKESSLSALLTAIQLSNVRWKTQSLWSNLGYLFVWGMFTIIWKKKKKQYLEQYFAGNLPCACCIKRDTVKLKVAPVTAISLCYADMLMCIIN